MRLRRCARWREPARALNGTVELHFTYDEEFGGLAGPGFLLDHRLTKPDYAIAASFSYAVVTAHNGCLQFEVTVHGKSGHGAMPETGRDAFRAGVAILNAIYAEADALKAKKSRAPGIDHPTMIVGLIEGGINTNVVPDRLTFRMDRRMTPEENPAEVEARVRALIEDAAARHDGIRVDIRRLLLANALKPRPGHEKLVAAIQRHAQGGVRRGHPGRRRAALRRRAPLRRAWRADRHVRRGSAHDRGIECQAAGRESAARGSAARDEGRRRDACTTCSSA